MALNLSTLTNSATSGTVLAEALTTADFLDPVPILKNLSRGSNKGGDAKQTTALNQPKALPLDANGKGYCYLPVTTGNAPAVTFPAIGGNDDFVLEMDVYLVSGTNLHFVSGANGDHRLAIYNGSFYIGGFNVSLSSPLALGVSNIKIERTSGTITLKQNDAVIASRASSSALTFTHLSFNGQFSTSIVPLNGYIQTCTLSIGGTEQLNIDFTATNVRHGDTKFNCVGGPVTINQSGFDPSTIIKKPVLRFPNSFMEGVLGQNLSSGHLFMAFSVLGSGGSSFVRLFSTNPTGGDDSINSMMIRRNSSGDELRVRYDNLGTIIHDGMYDSENGDMLLDVKMTNGAQTSFINNADQENKTLSGVVGVDDFVLAARKAGDFNAAIDLEFLALFSADSVPDEATATKIRDYINKRNNVFSLVDNSYYFFDPQKATFTGNFTGSNTLDGYITGSDLGDTDVRSNLTLEQSTLNDQPSTDGYTITFNDSAEHLEFENAASQNLSGWQICGTSLGTFVYRVQGAVTELNLLGNAGSSRAAGDSFGMLLLPESATGADIEQARKLLIDRGASESVTGSSAESFWINRSDIVEFSPVDFSGVTNVRFGWNSCSAMTTFNVGSLPDATNVYNAFRSSGLTSFNTDLPLAIRVDFAWNSCASLASFGAVDIKNCTNFTSAWQGCSALTSFPSGAKLGTSAANVNFNRAWQQSGLTSFPSNIDLSTGSNFSSAWQSCTALTSFPAGAKLGTSAQNVNFTSAWQSSGLTSFPSNIDLSNGVTFVSTWNDTNISSFPLLNLNNGRGFAFAWRDNNLLTDWPAGFFDNWTPSSITSGVFDVTWDGCTSLTAQSVENILTSIDASNQHGTDDGTSTGSPLVDSGIDIDYDGTTLSAATNTAVDSLKSKGWSIVVNGVTL